MHNSSDLVTRQSCLKVQSGVIPDPKWIGPSRAHIPAHLIAQSLFFLCVFIISPQRLWNSTVQPELVDEIVDELIPRSERGKGVDAGFINAICPTNDCGGSQENWENVSITRYGGDMGVSLPAQIHYATIQRRRDECRPTK